MLGMRTRVGATSRGGGSSPASTPPTGVTLPGGELLLDLSSTKLIASLKPATGTSDNHDFILPNDPSIEGLTFSAQAAILGGAYELCNAYDYMIGL